MTVTVLLFAQARELAGHSSVSLEMNMGATIGHLRDSLLQRFPDLAEILPHCIFSMDQQYANENQAIEFGSEIGCIPPVSGG